MLTAIKVIVGLMFISLAVYLRITEGSAPALVVFGAIFGVLYVTSLALYIYERSKRKVEFRRV